MASYCGWFFFATQKIFQTLTAHRIPENGSIHYDPRHSNKLWSCLKKRHYSPFHHMVYIYICIYIYYIYTSFSTSKIRFWMFWGVVCHFSSVFLSRVSMGWNSPYDLPVGQRGRWWALWRPTRRFQRRRLMHWQSEKVDDGWWRWLPSGKLTYIAIENHPC